MEDGKCEVCTLGTWRVGSVRFVHWEHEGGKCEVCTLGTWRVGSVRFVHWEHGR